MAKHLLILRHAKSSWDHPDLSDHDRPLNGRGKKAAPRMGQLIYEENLVPDVILSSTARRAVDTAKLVAESCGYAGEIILNDDFYPGWPSDYIETLCTLPDDVETAMVIGHNPGLEALLEALTTEVDPLPTAALAHVELPIAHWHQITEETEGELLHIWRPRDLSA